MQTPGHSLAWRRLFPIFLYLSVHLGLVYFAKCQTNTLNDCFMSTVCHLCCQKIQPCTCKGEAQCKANAPRLESTHGSLKIVIIKFNSKQSCVSGSNGNYLELRRSYQETRGKKNEWRWRQMQRINSWESFSINQRKIKQHRGGKDRPAITAKSFWVLLPCCSLSLFAVTVWSGEAETKKSINVSWYTRGLCDIMQRYLQSPAVTFTREV